VRRYHIIRFYWNKKNLTFKESIPLPTLPEAVQGISSTIIELVSWWKQKTAVKKLEIQNYYDICALGKRLQGASYAHFGAPLGPMRPRY